MIGETDSARSADVDRAGTVDDSGMTALSILDVACPACGAVAGELCRGPAEVCAERWAAWAEAKD